MSESDSRYFSISASSLSAAESSSSRLIPSTLSFRSAGIGDLFGLALAVCGVLVRFAAQQVHDPLELLALADRAAGERPLPARRTRGGCSTVLSKEACSLSILFTQKSAERRRSLTKPQIFSVPTSTPPSARTTITRGIDDVEAAQHLADEVLVARRVEDVDLVVLVLRVGHRRENRYLPLDFFGGGVRHRVAVFDPPHPGRRAGVEEYRLREHRLARVLVPDEGDVSDFVRGIFLHSGPPLDALHPSRQRAGSLS